MLSAAQKELITAAVDGELSATDAAAFQSLLNRLPEARTLFAKLKADSARVQVLPQATPPADLKAKILARVATITPAPKEQPAKSTPKATPAQPAPARFDRARSWVPVAVAASLLLCVAAGSFAFFSNPDSKKGPTAKNPWSNFLPAPHESPNTLPSPATPRDPVRPNPDNIVRNDALPVPIPHPKEVTPRSIDLAPEPRSATPDLIASPILPKLPPFDLVQVRLPFLRTVAELDRDDIRQELTDVLSHDTAIAPYRFDLFVRDTARGVDVFQNAAKASGLTVFADAGTLDKLKKKQVTSVVIYTENLTAAELAALFAKLTGEDKKFSPRVCDALHATPVVRQDELDLKAILGIDAGLYKRPTSGGTGKGSEKLIDKNGDPKSVSSGTIDSVSKTLTAPPAKPGKTAMLMTWQPGPARTKSDVSNELKQFIAKRGERKPNAVPAIIVIRPVG